MKILISRTDKIGDLVLSIPSFNAIYQMYPHAEIYCLVRKYNADIVRNLPYITDVIVKDDYETEALSKLIQNLKLDIFVALFSDTEIAKLAKESGAKKRIGPYSKLSSFFSYNSGLRQKRSESSKNEAEYNLDLIKSIDEEKFSKIKTLDYRVHIDKEYREKIKIWLEKRGIDKYIIVHPLSGGSAKNLSLNQYANLINKLSRIYDEYSIIVTGSGAEGEVVYDMVGRINRDNVFAWISSESIQYLSALLDKSELFIGSSTGPTHIAGSLGKKVVGIYPKIQVQSKVRWGIYGNRKVLYLEPKVECGEKYHCKKNCKHYDCFETLQIGEILAKINGLLGE
ncbi:MAG: glycosyltransferase family 9 protein [Fusobacteria bacterium]|nr:glycosyltransferase family 9 protein [Fusobacteriota bacterium]